MSACRWCALGRSSVPADRRVLSGGVHYLAPVHLGRGFPTCRDERLWLPHDMVRDLREALEDLRQVRIDGGDVRDYNAREHLEAALRASRRVEERFVPF